MFSMGEVGILPAAEAQLHIYWINIYNISTKHQLKRPANTGKTATSHLSANFHKVASNIQNKVSDTAD